MRADPETTTTQGCQCKSHCRASIHDRFKLDWCPTQNNCGKKGLLSGSWDHCVYKYSFSKDHSEHWKTKHDRIWEKVKHAPRKLGKYFVVKTWVESVITSYENEWDWMPSGRTKTFHSNGAVCPFEIEINKSSPFSGLLKPGKVTGIIRLGPGLYLMNKLNGLIPGASIKFLRTNVTSGDVVMLNGLNPQPNYNFFGVTMSNHAARGKLKDPRTNLLAKRFCQVGTCNTKVGISNLCTFDQNGIEQYPVNVPFKISLEPTGKIVFDKREPKSMEEFMAQFSAIPVGSRLYNLKAHLHPEDKRGITLGALVNTDQCVTSLYGDEKLFFRHQYIEDDIKVHPEWTDAYHKDCFCNYN